MEKQIFTFGDSITYGAIDPEGGWANRLRRHLDDRMHDSDGKEFFMLYNLGVSGDNTNDLLARFESELKARMDESEEIIVIFAIGINDSQYVNEKSNYRVSPADFESNLGKLYKQAMDNGAA
ncbi:MAG TPA: GDSL-type esterase/lipase family protein, partial [Thermodesulfobacteriota bacterium]|nr:GDSL-type esterase/lipase family protein [Thermodesulfobacteriota bacterium]